MWQVLGVLDILKLPYIFCLLFCGYFPSCFNCLVWVQNNIYEKLSCILQLSYQDWIRGVELRIYYKSGEHLLYPRFPMKLNIIVLFIYI